MVSDWLVPSCSSSSCCGCGICGSSGCSCGGGCCCSVGCCGCSSCVCCGCCSCCSGSSCVGSCGCSSCSGSILGKVVLIGHNWLGFCCIFSVGNVGIVVGLQLRWIILGQ